MAALTADGAADLQAGLNVDGSTTMDVRSSDKSKYKLKLIS
jgi:hypothetical protein